MQKTLYFLSIILFFSFANGGDEITITSKNSKLECHMCPGYILIEKGNTIDTLKMGSWGSPPHFEQFVYKKRNFLAFNSSYFMGGTGESYISIISLNEGNYLNTVFDTLVSDERINELNIKRQEIEFVAPDTLIINQHIEISNHKDEGIVKKDFKKEIGILSRRLTMEE
tara:strand:- start:874 stop:1380 length:507 start_codon:yes stop_codon:yes gene_type:complete